MEKLKIMSGMRRKMRVTWVVFAAAIAMTALTIAGTAAEAKAPEPDGRLVFERANPAVDDFDIMTANPDGSDLERVLPGPAECPTWSPTGRQILVCVVTRAGLIRPAIMNANGSHLTTLAVQDPTLNLGCMAWSGQGTLACESWDDADPSRLPGVFILRTDGSGLMRLTTNTLGGHDIPGDVSPDGSKIVFLRTATTDTETGTLYVVNTDGTGLHQISPADFAKGAGSWSPDGQQILFPNANGKLFVVRPDGSAKWQIPIQSTGWADVSEAVWSPDGTRIAAQVWIKGVGHGLFTLASDGTDLRAVAGTNGDDEAVDWGTSAG